MMQGFFEKEAETNPKLALQRFARLVLAVRKDVHNKNTKLEDWDMMKFMITDIDKYIA